MTLSSLIQEPLAPDSIRAAPPTRTSMTAPAFKRALFDHLFYTCAKNIGDATSFDMYRALAHTVRDRLIHRWLDTQHTYLARDVKRVCYLSSEFLLGRSLGLCLVNLGLHETADRILRERGFDLASIMAQEEDPGLGNGGLGRLAACFMDSLATLDLPAIGYGIRYDFGIFEQLIEDGCQVERRDNWLQHGRVWEIPRHEHSQVVRFGGRVESRTDHTGKLRMEWVGAREVLGLPFDSFFIGHQTNTVGTLRLWSARATREFNLALFNEGDYLRAVEDKFVSENISKVLYPNDYTLAGKLLRLQQEYFFVACSVADMLRHYKLNHATLHALPDRIAIQMNDTHPAIAVAELMRLLIDQEGLDWDTAWGLTGRTIAYTNHTLLPEALEKWPVAVFETLLPRHLQIIYEINHRFLKLVYIHWHGDETRMRRMSLIDEENKQVRMAHLAVVGSFSINGVAELHTQLIKEDLLKDFYELWPERFNNKTNGVTPRRWLLHANTRLRDLITTRIGSSWTERDFQRIQTLREYSSDGALLDALWQVKSENKQALAALVYERTHVKLDPNSMFVVQVKRIHEYKRQLLAILQVVALYLKIKREPNLEVTPRSYIFAGKAAAGYQTAKLHIRLINDVGAMINEDRSIGGRIKVAFIPNYGVSIAEVIFPGSDLSVQISLAGKEASGTGNMKFAMNGALTIGTLDGANIELRQAVGEENFFLFGLTAPEVKKLRQEGYDPNLFIARSPELREVVELLDSGFLSPEDRGRFLPVVRSLRGDDTFMVCADFDEYLRTEALAAETFRERRTWSRRALLNIAGSARFSSDETVRAYARDIWGVHPVPVEPNRIGEH